ncbi:hypothetical protein RI543_002948 [Arxiozyma heterogenica]|uniref:Bromo domain-containing protein n=1 Tax=Arxiozyma heterogenica TaxID=278026 RepID=A0AAN7WIV8_9SACH|nr:hypothetical protein RI543_002948 [Kazachstania heterogenica]
MARHLRNRDIGGPDSNSDEDHDEGFKDDNGVLHTTVRSLRKINYAEVEHGLDYLDEYEEEKSNDDNDEEEDKNKNHSPNTNTSSDVKQSNPHNFNIDQQREEEEEEEEQQQQQESQTDIGMQNNDHENGNTPHNLRKRKRRHLDEDDDESFHEEDVLDEDEDDEDDENEEYEMKYNYCDGSNRKYSYKRGSRNLHRYRDIERQRDKNFVVPDDSENQDSDDEEESYVYSTRSKTSRNTRNGRNKRDMQSTRSTRSTRAGKRTRRTTTRTPSPPSSTTRLLRSTRRRTRQSNHDSDDDTEDHLTLADEIKELEEDSPIREMKRPLRERTKRINYAIPPPLTATSAEEYLKQQSNISSTVGRGDNISPSRRGKSNSNINPTRRLFPTGGPFGGNDVITVFGENSDFYGINNFLSSNNNNITSNANNNKLILDSDSSEDEILPLGAKPKSKKMDDKKKKKKPEIADLDPLGVDMNIGFEDIGGLDNYIDQLKEMVVLPLLYPELYQNFNITPPRGVLFHGPPGTGKTLMARALAASCSTEDRKITFFMRKGADILSKWVGEAERQLRLLFEEAKKQQPSIIFFDEIDGLAPVRSSKQEQIHASIVSTMLALMDGMDNRGQVIVIGATNRPDAVDPALRRPGRFDREFFFPLPDEKARAKIISIHTKKWTPSLSEEFINNLARLTKGYGGADLRALCTEAALFSIQRKFPQIYRSNEKLQVDRTQLRVTTNDFMLALQKMVPSSARSTGSVPEPLPEMIKPLLDDQFRNVQAVLSNILPQNPLSFRQDTSLIQHYLDYQTVEEDYDGMNRKGTLTNLFGKHELLNQISNARICKPRLLITGPMGNGQQYLGAAILSYLEGYNVQTLDVASILSESSRSIEAAIIQGFVEARKRQPSILFIPNLDIWSRTVPPSAVFTLASLLRSLQSNEKVLLLGIAEMLSKEDLMEEPLSHISFFNNIFYIDKPSKEQRKRYFKRLEEILHMKPTEFELERRRKKPLPNLPLAGRETIASNLDENGDLLSPEEVLRRKLKSFQYQDMKLKNVIKIKLSGLMDLFKNRYRKFRKPPIEDSLLVHLFDTQPIDSNWQPAYVKDNNMILEVATGRRYYNMDLDIVEERLWNGYYSEPKQFLRDIELIYLDAYTTGDRERIIKASEMFANAQMGIEDISQPDLIRACKELRKRDSQREALAIKDAALSQVEGVSAETQSQTEFLQTSSNDIQSTNEVGIGAGTQLQAQLQLNPSKNDDINTILPVDIKLSDTISTSVNDNNQELILQNDLINDLDNAKANIIDSTVTDKDEAKIKQTGLLLQNDDDLNVSKVSENQSELIDNTIENKKSDSRSIAEQTGTDIEQNGVEEDNLSEENNYEKEIIVQQSKVDELLNSLERITQEATISNLEEIYSHMMNIVWQGRFNWDKTETLNKLLEFAEK